MASKKRISTIENLPSDVLSDIFIRLFAKQLAQMRCVSKSWNSLLSQPSFIKSHLRRSIYNSQKILLFFYTGCEQWILPSKPFTVHPYKSPHVQLTDFIKRPVNLKSEGATVIGSVNGLICLYYGSGNSFVVHIWNPSLSAMLTLPPYCMPSRSRGQDRIGNYFRFGFDPKSDDYKVVKLACLLQPPSFLDPMIAAYLGLEYFVVKEWLQVEVYNMRKRSWKFITQRFPSHITGISRQDKVCVDGHDGLLHWLCFTNETKAQTIVAFDLSFETFREIPAPDFVRNFNKRINSLGVLAGKLCVMSCVVRDGECEVWVMEEYGVVESWVKNHVFSQFSGNIDPYGFTLHNEFLIGVYNNRLALYDPIEAKVKIFKINDRRFGVAKVVDYVDSLVWVAPPAKGL